MASLFDKFLISLCNHLVLSEHKKQVKVLKLKKKNPQSTLMAGLPCTTAVLYYVITYSKCWWQLVIEVLPWRKINFQNSLLTCTVMLTTWTPQLCNAIQAKSRSENASTGHEQMHVCMHARTDGWIKNIMSTAAHRVGSGSMKNKHNQWLSAYLGW